MNNLINSLERRLGRYAISNLTLYMIILYGTGFIMELVAGNVLISYLSLDIYQVSRGQIWRLVTWLFMPPERLSIFTIFMLMLYYFLGSSLERVWGSFRYNLFIFSGIIFTILGALVVYIIMLTKVHGLDGADEYLKLLSMTAREGYNTYYINTSIFLAYASIFPNEKLYLYFFIPIKIKWLAALDLAMILYYMIRGNLVSRITMIAALLNVALYALANYEAIKVRKSAAPKRKSDYIKIVTPQKEGYRHKCVICGRTDVTNPELEFRYCSKCDGAYEYCNDHLFTHVHKKVDKDIFY